MALQRRAGAALLLLVACSTLDCAKGQYSSFYDAVSQLSSQFSILKQTVDTANLTQILSDGTLQGILLAPTNNAFLNTLQAFPNATAFANNPNVSALVLAYHLLPMNTNQPELTVQDGTTLPTFLLSVANATIQAGTLGNVTFKQTSQGMYYVGGLAPGGMLSTNQSYTAGNGRIYVLQDGILIPPSKIVSVSSGPVALTIAELLQNTTGYTNLTALVLADPTLTSFATNPDNAVTVFAPSDKAFASFFRKNNVTLQDIQGTPLAQRIVLNHVVPSRPYTTSQLQSANTSASNSSSSNTTITLPTAAPGDNITLTFKGNNVRGATIEGGGNMIPINITAFNLTAGKSVVHAIDGIILPNQTASGNNTSPGMTGPGMSSPSMYPPGTTAPPGSIGGGGSESGGPPGSSSPPAAASMVSSSAWLLSTLLGAAMLLAMGQM